MRHRRLPGAVGFPPGGLRPVAEPVGVLPFPIQEIEVHGRAFVRDLHLREGPPPALHGLLEGEVRVQFLGHVPRQREAAIPGLQRALAEALGHRVAARREDRARGPFQPDPSGQNGKPNKRKMVCKGG